jgi:hypothetical protein
VALSLILNLVSGSVLAMSAPILNVGPEYVLGEATPQDEINSRSYEIAVLKATEKRRPEVRETIGLLERRLEALKAASHPIRRWERMAQPGRWSPVALWAQMWAASIGLGVAKQWPMIIVFSLKVIRRPNTLVCLKAAILSVLVVHAMYLLVYLAAPGTPYSALHR